jgi:hypothetical protein
MTTQSLTHLNDTELLDLLDQVSAEVKRRNTLVPSESESFVDQEALKNATAAFARMMKDVTSQGR